MPGTTPMTLLSFQFVSGFGLAVGDSSLDEHLYSRFGHHQFGAVCGERLLSTKFKNIVPFQIISLDGV